ncbi:hypothetical protein, partial [Streptomyces benahoarensis]
MLGRNLAVALLGTLLVRLLRVLGLLLRRVLRLLVLWGVRALVVGLLRVGNVAVRGRAPGGVEA